ncbi:Putative ribonuclease H protein At1g65750 [Linum perenne]
MRAEIRGILEGMKIAWDKGIRKLCIQTDSQAAVFLLTSNDGRLYRHMSLVEQFLDWRNRDWEVMIQHIYREANNAADYLANLVILWFLGLMFFRPQATLFCTAYVIMFGVSTPRSINNTS